VIICFLLALRCKRVDEHAEWRSRSFGLATTARKRRGSTTQGHSPNCATLVKARNREKREASAECRQCDAALRVDANQHIRAKLPNILNSRD
jgi:hypothetical protein